MKVKVWGMVVFTAIFFFAVNHVHAQDTIVSRVIIEGNKRIPTETIMSYVTLEEGDAYNEQLLRVDFLQLWNTDFFSNLKIYRENDQSGDGIVVRIVVTERPLVRDVVYRGLKAVGKSKIEEKMKEQSLEIPKGKLLHPTAVARVLNIIRDQMEEKGLEFGEVSVVYEEASPIEVDVVFDVREGGKVKISEVQFVGNEHFSQWELTRVLKKSRPSWIFSWIQKDNIYSSKLLEEDLREIEKFYADHGFLRVTVKEPVVDTQSKSDGTKTNAVISIPISEGGQYRVSKINFIGPKLVKEDFLRSFFKLKEGELYNRKAIEKSFEELTDFYYGQGYVEAFFEDRIEYVPDRVGEVNLDIYVTEGEPYYIRRIKFEGNRSTRDKVLRRNIYLVEQQPFNVQALKDSLRRLNQLGFFGNVEPDPVINREDKSVDLTFKVTETGKNQVQFGGGYSGIEGLFFNFAFQTSNFWGQGQTLTFILQTGARNKNYEITFFDPWLFNRPIGSGISFFSRSFEFQDFVRNGQGGRLNFSLRVARFTSLFFEYRYELVEIRNPEDYPFTGSLFFPEGRTATGSITPTIVRDTVDHPFLSTRGHRDTFSVEYGTPYLGGDFTFLKFRVEHIGHLPLSQRNVIRFRAQLGYAKMLDEEGELPVFERYFMGGEYTIRGYELRTVGPRDEYNRIIGGTSSVLINLEYMFLVTNEIRIVPFVDMGNAYSGGINWRDIQYSAGLEVRFFVPVMNIPFRFILAKPINPKDYHRTNSFLFTLGTNF
jgi:outer membrane protein insertion porin family